MRRNPTVPVPETFEHEPALMTRAEYLDFQNERGKHHDSRAYQVSVADFNRLPLTQVGNTEPDRNGRRLVVEAPTDGREILVFRDKESGVVVGMMEQGHLFKGRFAKIPEWYLDMRTREPVMIRPTSVREQKYPEQQLMPAHFDVRKSNQEQYPIVLQRFDAGGQRFELRAERVPRKNKLDTVVVMHDGLVVAMGSDEWGATLIRVAEEFRQLGLGALLKDYWAETNPDARSGGFTLSGERMALGSWERRVREFLARGWYTELVRLGRIGKDRVREILSGLHGKIGPARLPSDAPRVEEEEPSLLLYLDDGSFILYDERFLQEPDEKYVYGYGFLRETDRTGPFFFRLDYDLDYADLVTATALQMARDMKEPVYVEDIPGDLVEWQRIPSATYVDGRVTLKKDILDLKKLSREERSKRGKVDRFDELRYRLMELADSKWS